MRIILKINIELKNDENKSLLYRQNQRTISKRWD